MRLALDGYDSGGESDTQNHGARTYLQGQSAR